MKLNNLLEAISEKHQRDAIRIANTSPESIHDTSDPSAHTEINDAWKTARDKFLSKHPEAQKLFAMHAGEAKRPYQIRINNILLANNPVEIDLMLLKQVYSAATKIPGVPSFDEFFHSAHKDARGENFFTVIHSVSGSTIRALTGIIENFKKGLLVVPKTGREGMIQYQTIRIGAFLTRLGEHKLLQKYNEFAQLANQRPASYDIIISGHPIDIYGMSSGRGWVSCATLDGSGNTPDKFEIGGNQTHAAAAIGEDIHNDTHIVYLVKRGGDVDHDAIARIVYKKHISATNKEVLISDNRVYGHQMSSFLEYANKYMHELFGVEDGIYHQCYGTYVEAGALKRVGNGSTPDMPKTFISHIITRLRGLRYGDKGEDEEDEKRFYKAEGGNLANNINGLDQTSFNLFMDEFDNMVYDIPFLDDIPSNIDDIVHNLTNIMDISSSLDQLNIGPAIDFLEQLNSKKINLWYTTTHHDKILALVSGIVTELAHSFELYDNGESNLDDGLFELEHLFRQYSRFFNHNVHISHSGLSSSGRAFIQYIHSKYPNFAKIFDDEKLSKTIGKDTISILLDEFKHLSAHLEEHVGEPLETSYKQFHGIFNKMNRISGEDLKPLDWLYQVEQKYGHQVVGKLDGMEYVSDWFKRFLVDAFTSSLILEDGHVYLRRQTEEAAKAFVDKLKTLASSNGPVNRAIELVDSQGIDLTKFLKD